jgi:ABC-type dipeptide/oligopeptide/nickel transport system permease component
MLSYIVHRLLLMIPTLIGITIVVFLTMAITPGGITASLEQMTQGMRPEEARAVEQYMRDRYGLDQPLPMQYLNWLNSVSPIGQWRNPDTAGLGIPLYQADDGQWVRFGLKEPDLGQSFIKNQRVSGLLASALPVTVMLNILAFPLIYLVAITSGVYAARHRGRWFDISSSVFLLALWSIPIMWAGVMMIGLLANKQFLYWFPTGGLHSTGSETMAFLPHWTGGDFQRGWLLDMLWHLVLPVVCLTYPGLAFLSKLMRASVLENLFSDFVRTARAKGVNEKDILWRHVLRNSLLPLITIAATLVPALLGGSLIIEEIFSLEGMGKLMIEAVKTKDRELVMSITFIISLLTLTSLIVRDVCYALVDPRVSFD